MIVRPFTFISALLFVLSGAYLFGVKHRSQMLDQQLEQIADATRQDQQSIRVMQAQWALEADPSRLASLAAQFTGLQPMKPGQLITLADLSTVLPAPGAAVPVVNPEGPVPAMPVVAQAKAAPAPVQQQKVAAVTQPAAPASAPAAVAKRNLGSTEHMASVEAVLRSLPAHRAAHVQHDAEPSHIYFASGSQPPVRQTQPAPEISTAPQIVAVRAVAAAAPLDNGGSMLGMAQGGSAN
jgi:hypothetical protein